MKKTIKLFGTRNPQTLIIFLALFIGLTFTSCESPTDSKPNVLDAPAGLVSVSKTDTTISVTWNTVSGAVKYHVYAGITQDNLTLKSSPTVTFCQIEGLTPNTTYYIAVSAEDEGGEGGRSDIITVATSQIVIPSVPTGLASVTNTETSIALIWNAVSGAAKYNVYLGTVAGDLTLWDSTSTTSYLIEGLETDTTYYIEVSAENAAGEGEKSASITVTTNLSVKPAAPSGLIAGVITDNSITVSWNSVTGASNYKVFAGTISETMLLQGEPTGTSFTITELISNTAYSIVVSTRTATNESDQCTPITVMTKPPAPASLTAGTVTSNSISVTWADMDDVSGYTVYAGTTSDTMTQRGTPVAATYTITGLAANTEYYIAITAENASGESVQSSPITVTTKLSAPSGVIATPLIASSSIQVSWNAVSGAASYKVYRSPTAGGTYTVIDTTPGTSYNNTGLTVSTTYYYKVSAVTGGGIEGDLSDYVYTAISSQTKEITSFRFDDFGVNGTINGPNVSVSVPNIVNLTALVPTINHNGKSVSPASGVAQNFSSGPIQYTVTAEDNATFTYTVTVTVSSTNLATAFNWINSNARSGRTYTIVAQASASLAPVTIDPNYSNVNIILSGGATEKIITLSGNGSLFTIRDGTLTLDNNITLQGHSSNNASLVRLDSYSNLVMNTGSRIINNTATVSYTNTSRNAIGGGVYIYEGTFTMNGGTISGNRVVSTTSSSGYTSTVRAMGGGVYIEDGSFNMINGTITNNTAYSDKFAAAGGGVYVGHYNSSYYGSFTMNGGTISGNTAQSSSVLATSYTYGGGVATGDYGRFTMQNGTISGNTVITANNRLGGGVYVRNDRFTKTGGTIYGSNASPTSLQNTAGGTNGHAVYASVNSTILRRNNTAGTGVNLDSSKTGSAGGWE